MSSKTYCRQLVFILVLLIPIMGTAQTTEFTYQGKLTDAGLPANANYDFEFRLFAAETGGVAITTLTRLAVPVADGIFTVKLDFGGQFDGNARWLEIAVKPAASPNPLTVLIPRQLLTSTPYSIRSQSSARADVATNSLQLGGVSASQYVLTTDARMTDARTPLPNSSNYVQNTATPQSSSNFNISGNGTAGGTLSANAFNATTQFNIGGSRILSNAGTNNLFAGVGAGQSNTTGSANAFFGRNAGTANSAGQSNAFFGDSAGASNSTGDQNSFFGFFGGLANTIGVRNSYFGYRAGQQGTTGDGNAFFGYHAGLANTTNRNSFFGASSGEANTTGAGNAFFGYKAGNINLDGYANSFFGYTAGFSNTAGSNNSFFGQASGSSNTSGKYNSSFGDSAGLSQTTTTANSFFGATAGWMTTTGGFNSFFGSLAGQRNTTGTFNTLIGEEADVGSGNLTFATAIGAQAVVSTSNTIVLGRIDGSDKVVIYGLATSGALDICRNGSNQLSTCSSSLRYKTDVQSFTEGLQVVNRLRPITFAWKDGGMRDVGFGAEEVEKIEPLLVIYNDKGEVEGVKYRQLTTVLVNAIREQQASIDRLQKQIGEQTELIKKQQFAIEALKEKVSDVEALKRLVCQQDPAAEICEGQQK